MKKCELSIIIVNFNTKQLTLECIDSIIQTTHDINYEIILVDNSTISAEQITVNTGIVSSYTIDNHGYGNANNYGFRMSCGDYILLLNPDTIVYDYTISKCLSYLRSHSTIGALGCRVLRPDGSLDHACRRGFPTPLNSFFYFSKLGKLFPHNKKLNQYTYSFLDETTSCSVDSLTGAFMLLPRCVAEETTLFDELFFMYGEDLDLCYRIKELSYDVFYLATVTILHKKYQSGIAKSSSFVIKQFYLSMILFYNKHYKTQYNILINTCVKLGIYSIMYLKLIVNHFLK